MAAPAGSSWIPPSVCVSCWTRKRTLPGPFDLLGSTPHRQQPAAPATPCGWPATRPPTPPTGLQPHRRRSGFNEAVEELEAGYEGTALTTGDLEKYYRMAEDFLSRCGASETIEPQKKAEDEAPRRQKVPEKAAAHPAQAPEQAEAARPRRGHQAAAGIPLAGTAAAARICRPRPAARSVSAPRAALSPWCCWPSSCWGLLVRAWTMGLMK